MSDRKILIGGLLRCCILSIHEYSGEEKEGLEIPCKFHENKEEPVVVIKNGVWQWIGYEKANSNNA